MKKQTLQTIGLILLLTPIAAWAAGGILPKFSLSKHHGFKGGYVWNDNPSGTLGDPLTPQPQWNWNYSGAQNTVTRVATGYYQITFPNLGNRPGNGASFGGNVVVSAYYTGPPTSCSVAGWESFFAGTDVTANVVCFNTTTGALVDSYFSALLTF